MTKTRKQWKLEARRALQGNFMLAVPAMLATVGVNFLGTLLADTFFPDPGLMSTILAECFVFIFSLILSILMAGYSYLMMNLARGREAGLGDLLYFFKNQPDRVIIAGFVMALLQLLASVPSLIFSYTTQMGSTVEAQLDWMTRFLVLTVAAAVLQLLLTLPFACSYYLLADDESLSGWESLKQSARMMRSHFFDFILLQMSFLPMMILSIFMLYLPMLWVLPYMEMSNVEFYRDLNGEFEEDSCDRETLQTY